MHHPIEKIIADTDTHIRASVERVMKARDFFERISAVVRRSETACAQSQARLARLNGDGRHGDGRQLPDLTKRDAD
jgi:hypothetical protein